MRATVMHAAGDVRVEDVPDVAIEQPTDVTLRVTRACICGSDLWPYRQMTGEEPARRMGHEFIGIVEDVGREVRTLSDVFVGHHADRVALARELGATDVVAERGEAAVERMRELTNGDGAHSVLECVGHEEAFTTALAITRPGGAIGRVGAPQYANAPNVRAHFGANITVGGGPAPTRAYIEELLPDVLEGRVDPGRVFDRTIGLHGVPEGYREMDERRSLKVLIRP